MLGWISSDFFARSPLLLGPLIALGIFAAIFIGAAIRAMATRDETLELLQRMPLDDSEGKRHV